MNRQPVIQPKFQNSQAMPTEQQRPTPRPEPLIRRDTNIIVNPFSSHYVDKSIVSFHYYNSFNYSLLADQKNDLHLTIGVTSANRGEGKTLTASNLAVSLTLGYQRKTVLVDLNLQVPRVHQVFGSPVGPGLSEALDGGGIHVSPTSIGNLSVLTAGYPPNGPADGRRKRGDTPLGVEQTATFGAVIRALQEEFDFIIVDMPAMSVRAFPILFVNHLDGVFVVVEAGRTKRRDVEKMFQRLNKNQVLGFVFNRVKDDFE
jgi:Mrp family chromosome partitioning ATPase